MSTPFSNNSFGTGQPHRRILKGRVFTDAQGNEVFQPVEGEAHIISDENSLDAIPLDFDAFLDCGCSLKTSRTRYHCCEPGCPHVICEQHVKFCLVCSKGLCGQCHYYLETSPGQRIDLCQIHYREANRRRLWHRVAQIALSPFVTFDNRDPSK